MTLNWDAYFKTTIIASITGWFLYHITMTSCVNFPLISCQNLSNLQWSKVFENLDFWPQAITVLGIEWGSVICYFHLLSRSWPVIFFRIVHSRKDHVLKMTLIEENYKYRSLEQRTDYSTCFSLITCRENHCRKSSHFCTYSSVNTKYFLAFLFKICFYQSFM